MKIVLANDFSMHSADFVTWLKQRGDDAMIGADTDTYIDGERYELWNRRTKVFKKLWNEFRDLNREVWQAESRKRRERR